MYSESLHCVRKLELKYIVLVKEYTQIITITLELSHDL